MTKTAHVKVGQPDDRDLWIPCGTCNRETSHRVLSLVQETDGNDDIQVWHDYQIVQCRGCKAVSFCEESRCTEDMEPDPDTGEPTLAVTSTFYPSRVAGRPPLDRSYLLPTGVGRVYEEAHAAFCSKLPVLAGVGIRAVVEAVCKERGTKGSTLKERIDELAAMHLVTPDGARILHDLRFMGNAAIHEMRGHSEEELHRGFDVVEYLLKGVYILPRLAAAPRTPQVEE